MRYASLDVIGYPKYRISEYGDVSRIQVKKKSWRPHKTQTNKQGYLCIALCRDRKIKVFSVHRLVLFAFVGLPPEGLIACHNDGDHLNNHISNLRWDTPESNYRDRDRHGRTMIGEKNKMAKLTEKDVLTMRDLHARGIHTKYRLAIMYGVSQVLSGKIINRVLWRHI